MKNDYASGHCQRLVSIIFIPELVNNAFNVDKISLISYN